MFHGKMKALTFSYDDGVTQDIRLIELFNKYGMKATFNLNSSLLGKPGRLLREGVSVDHTKVNREDVRRIYDGHEVASHTMTHPFLPSMCDSEVISQVECDRQRLSDIVGYEVVGFAYPGGGKNYDRRISDLIKENTGVRYCRHTVSNHSFDPQKDLYEFAPTVYHHGEFDKMTELGEEFLASNPDKPQILYIWGHAYEFDIRNDWERFERFLEMMSGRDDIFYGTNKEVLL